MCPDYEMTPAGQQYLLNVRLENGSTDSPGPTGEPSPSELAAHETALDVIPVSAKLAGATLVLHPMGLSNISVGFCTRVEECLGTFTALRQGPSGAYTVTLSCAMTSSQYAALIQTLESTPSEPGEPVMVDVRFEPMTLNLVPPTTALST